MGGGMSLKRTKLDFVEENQVLRQKLAALHTSERALVLCDELEETGADSVVARLLAEVTTARAEVFSLGERIMHALSAIEHGAGLQSVRRILTQKASVGDPNEIRYSTATNQARETRLWRARLDATLAAELPRIYERRIREMGVPAARIEIQVDSRELEAEVEDRHSIVPYLLESIARAPMREVHSTGPVVVTQAMRRFGLSFHVVITVGPAQCPRCSDTPPSDVRCPECGLAGAEWVP